MTVGLQFLQTGKVECQLLIGKSYRFRCVRAFFSNRIEIVNGQSRLPLALVRLNLLTGRKHQLRVHLAHCLQSKLIPTPAFLLLNYLQHRSLATGSIL